MKFETINKDIEEYPIHSKDITIGGFLFINHRGIYHPYTIRRDANPDLVSSKGGRSLLSVTLSFSSSVAQDFA